MSKSNSTRPSDWNPISLADAASDESNSFIDGDWVEARWIGKGDIRLVQTGNVGIGRFENKPKNARYINQHGFKQLNCKSVYGGDILICRLADPIGRACIVPETAEPCITSVDVTIFRPDPNKLDRSFAIHLLNFGEQLRKAADIAGGTTRQRISRSNLGRMEVVVPIPEEQRRIAEILDTADEAIQKTEALIAKLKQMKAGLLHDLLTRGIDENGELRTPSSKSIPDTWSCEPLVNFAQDTSGSFVNGPFGSDLLTRELTLEGVPVIYIRDIKPFEYRRVSTACVTDEKANQLRVCNVVNGDVLLSKVGDPPCDAAVYSYEFRSVITQDVIRIRPRRDVDPRFLAALLNSAIGRKAIRKIVIQGTRARVSLTDLKRIVLPRPGKDEQERISERLHASEKQIESERNVLTKLKKLKAGLMHDLLTGNKRVKTLEPVTA